MSFLQLLIEMVCNLTGVLVALHLPNYQGDTTVFNTDSHAFESSQDLIIRRLILYWKASCISLTMFHHCIMQFLMCIPCYVHPAFIVFRIVQSIVFVYRCLRLFFRVTSLVPGQSYDYLSCQMIYPEGSGWNWPAPKHKKKESCAWSLECTVYGVPAHIVVVEIKCAYVPLTMYGVCCYHVVAKYLATYRSNG